MDVVQRKYQYTMISPRELNELIMILPNVYDYGIGSGDDNLANQHSTIVDGSSYSGMLWRHC